MIYSGKITAYDTYGGFLTCRYYSSKNKRNSIISFLHFDYKDDLGWYEIEPETNDYFIDGKGRNTNVAPKNYISKKDEPLRFPGDYGIKKNRLKRKTDKYAKTYHINSFNHNP